MAEDLKALARRAYAIMGGGDLDELDELRELGCQPRVRISSSVARMRVRRSVVVGLVALVAVVVGTTTAAGASVRSGVPLPPEQRAELDAAVRAVLRVASTPGAVVGVQTPEGRWVRGFGIADVRSKARMRPTVHHRIGSVTKTFTAAVLMQLVGEGTLSLDDTIDKYLSGVPNGETITLRQVADMTSGVASYTKNPAFTKALFANPERRWTPDEVLKLGLEESPDFPPGTEFEYSNTNFLLLGKVIEGVEDKPIGVVYRERIFDPLKLRETSWPAGSTRLPAPHAQGYTLQGQSSDVPVDATRWSVSAEWTAGELISTVRDLLVYGRATGTGEGLLSPGLQQQRLDSFNPRIPPESPTLSYGFGLVNDNGWIGHTGQVPGFTTAVYYHPDIDTTVVVEANSDIASGECRGQEELEHDPISAPCANPADRIMRAIARALGRPYELPPG
jgi:D-alanyl-D-alanine carboxypeptidase